MIVAKCVATSGCEIAAKQSWSLYLHGVRPCLEHGLQPRLVEKERLCFIRGGNPKPSTVGPKRTATGVPTASAMCPRAESLLRSPML